ncbi:unnamed protein product [Effrenium voratum]|uniref:Uncharacterized protein n=1 Tax=Effrenium voratum TaxID=2562239 RepID=A0AA36JCF6_9DINO|nr:unnamed protein product [Effrenium voratum]CAJ1443631.1 unnamed protein product [Effrenium voratum]|mmetsp:Transcript_47519/g.113031  ORF Transcript_47519/g.113031 Transcript_47519/m.113031 type:complete len:458 (-) Transcript_47519:152-1525(-)
MIFYDNKSFRALCTLRGSVFPKASLYALPFALLAVVLKWLSSDGHINLADLDLISDGSVYSAFTFVLSFTLVFRCQQAYQRYFASAKAMHMMSSEWIDACGSLMSFVKMARKSEGEKMQCEAVLVRLFCLLHALAMEELCNLAEENFGLLDIEAFPKLDLAVLHDSRMPTSHKTHVVLIWIKFFIVQCEYTGLLPVPAPILTRVYQEIGAGMAEFHDAQCISMWPFPFPYAQLSMFLKVLHMLITPFVMVQYCDKIWSAGGFTFVSLVCMSALNIIGVELENPFGDDPNDLPANETHNDFRESLLTLTDPAVWRVPGLLPTAKLDFRQLQAANSTSLSRYLNGLDVLKEANAKEAKELEEIGEIDKMRDKTQETRGPGPGGPGGPGSGPEDPWVLEEWLRRQTALLENFLAKQNDMLEQHALAMRCASLPKEQAAASVFAAPKEQSLCGCSVQPRRR